MSESKQSKVVMVVVGVVAAGLLAAGAFLLLKQATTEESAANVVASVLPDNVVGVAWSTSIDEALALLEASKINGGALDSLGVDYSRIVALLGFDPLDAKALQGIGIDTAGVPLVALAPAPKSEGLVLIYLPILAGKSGIDAVLAVAGKFGDKAPLVEKAEEKGHAIGWVYRQKVDHQTLWENACDHAIKVLKDSGAIPEKEFSSEMRDQFSRDCQREFSSMDSDNADQAATCVLETSEMKGLELCMEDAKEGRLSDKDKGATPVQKSLRGALVDVDGGLIVVAPVDYSRHDREAIETEIRAYVTRIVDSSVPRLDSVDGYEEAVAGSGGALLGFYANPVGLRELLAGSRELAPLATALGEVAGFGAYLKEEGNSLIAVVQTVASGKEPKQFLRKRDQKVLELIPGEPLVGFHAAVEAEALLREMERGLALEPRLWRDYVEGKQEIQGVLKVPGTELHQVWDGEFGIFLGEIAPSPEFMVRSIVAFVGIKDLDKLNTALDAATALAGGKLLAEKVGDAKAWQFSEDGLTMGIMVHQNRLWFAGDYSVLAKIEKGESGKLLSGERSQQIAAIMTEDNALASFADLKKPLSLAQGLVSRGDKEVFDAIWPALSKLDYITYSGEQEGRVSTAKASLHMEGLSFTSAVAEALAAQFLAAADKYGRRAKTTEVIDNLDKLYKSASLYYTTPRISQVGEKLDCQFPDDAPLTPSNNCCGSYGGTDADADGRCDVQYDSWTTATWSSLMFQMVDQHYCVYSFDSNGQTGNEAAFTANAHCDLDCDGIMSTFQRYGKGEATYGECYVQSAAALFTQNETE